MTRTALPYRRPNATRAVEFGGHEFTITIGFDVLVGRPREVFSDGHREGSAMQAIIDDACVIISIALQCGISASALAHSLGTVPTWRNGVEATGPASVVGTILEALIAEDRP